MNELTECLKERPIYLIYQKSSGKDNQTAIQFMFIVDFYVQDIKLYDRIKEIEQPKLLGQLLQFSQFERFKYFHYSVSKQYGTYVLQCKYCELVGLCGPILTHMTINHNVHTPLNFCLFCNSETLETHLSNDSLAQCYSNYIERNAIEIDEKVCKIVTNFYEMLKKLCQNLNICSTRRKGYAGKGYRCKGQLSQDYGGDIARECEIRYMIPKNQQKRTIKSTSFDDEFKKIMGIAYGGNYLGRSSKKQHLPIFDMDDYSEDGDNEVNNITAENSGIVIQNVREHVVKPDPGFNDSSTPSYANPIASTPTSMEHRLSRLSTFSSSSFGRQLSETEKFAWSIATKLEKIPQEQRQELQEDFEMKVLQIIKERRYQQ